MTEHTPGPWAVIGGPSKYNQVFAEGAKTAETSGFLTGWISPANAHLIAAAPALLAAAEAARPLLDACAALDARPDIAYAVIQKMGPEVDRALRAAIAQARGEE